MKMRRKFAYLWLVIPVVLITIHYQWGIEKLEKEKALSIAREAVVLEKKAWETWSPEDWENAQEAYDEAIANLPDNELQSRAELELASARSCLYKGELVEAMDSLKHLLKRTESENIDPELKDEIRETLARSQYGIAWVMRKKHVNRSVWNNIAEASRQNFRYLAENASNTINKETYIKDLEASVRLVNSGKKTKTNTVKKSPFGNNKFQGRKSSDGSNKLRRRKNSPGSNQF